MLFLFLIISFFSDYKFLDTKERTSVKNVKEVQKILSVREAALSASFAVINKLEIAMSGNTELNNFIVTDDVFDVNNQKVDFDDNISVLNESNISASYNELLIKLFEIDSNLKFKVFDSMFDDKNAKNLVLRFKNEDSALDVINEIKNFNNMFLKKASFSKDKASLHLYITIIEP
jgi:hypothetical protein